MIRWVVRTKDCPNIFKNGRTYKSEKGAKAVLYRWAEYFGGLYTEPVEVVTEEDSIRKDFESCSEELKEAIFKLEQYRDLILGADKIMDGWIQRTQLDSDDIHQWKLKINAMCKIVGGYPPKKS